MRGGRLGQGRAGCLGARDATLCWGRAGQGVWGPGTLPCVGVGQGRVSGGQGCYPVLGQGRHLGVVPPPPPPVVPNMRSLVCVVSWCRPPPPSPGVPNLALPGVRCVWPQGVPRRGPTGVWPGLAGRAAVMGGGGTGSRCRAGEGCRAQGSESRAQVVGCRAQGSGSRVQGVGCRVQGSGSRVQSPRCRL